jgi:glutathione S-transferase
MNLLFSPGACSLASHIVAREAHIPVTIERVDLASKKTAAGRDFLKINPKGYVPALELDDGEVLTEGAAIMQYLADKKPEAKLAAPNGSFERLRLQEWLVFIATEVHKTYSPLFDKTLDPGTREKQIAKLQKRYAIVEEALTKHPYLTGDQFSVADAYLFTVTRWAAPMKIDLSAFKALGTFMERVSKRDSVQQALDAENGAKH